jgi:hypothetical protein
MSNELAIRPRNYEEMMQMAHAVHASKLAPKDISSPEAILVAMQHGMELGLSPMQAVQSVAVINGRPVVWGDAALAIVKGHPECEDVIETFERGETEDALLAKCVVQRRGKAAVVRTFSVAQARKAGLWDKAGPWKQYPQRMLQCRARSWALRDSFPDALKGVGIAEEVRDTDPHIPAAKVKLVLPDDEQATVTMLQLPESEPVEVGQ